MANFRNITIAVLFLFICSTTVFAQEESECRGKPLNLSEKEKNHITDCLAADKIDDIWKIPWERLPCFGVCILKWRNMLDDQGKIHTESVKKWLEIHLKDAELQKLLVDATDKCIKEHGEEVTADDDPNCLTFLKGGQCIHDVFLEICTTDP